MSDEELENAEPLDVMASAEETSEGQSPEDQNEAQQSVSPDPSENAPVMEEGEGVETPASKEPDQALPSSSEPLTPLGGNVMSIKQIQGIKVNVQVILGSVTLSVSKLASLKKGELIELDSALGDPVDILANGHLIARGEIVVVEENDSRFGITLSEIVESEIVA